MLAGVISHIFSSARRARQVQKYDALQRDPSGFIEADTTERDGKAEVNKQLQAEIL